MVEMIAKLTRRQSRALREQVGVEGLGGKLRGPYVVMAGWRGAPSKPASPS
jgi:hypothetical protein